MKQKEVKEYKETHLPLISKKVDDYVWAMCAVYTAPAVGYWEEKKKEIGKVSLRLLNRWLKCVPI